MSKGIIKGFKAGREQVHISHLGIMNYPISFLVLDLDFSMKLLTIS